MTAFNPDMTRHIVNRWWFVPFCVGAMVILVWGRFAGWTTPIVERDLHQNRSDVAAPLPSGKLTLSQTFTTQKNGFSELDVRLVRYGEPQPDSTGQILFSIRDAQGVLIAEERRMVANHNHSDVITLSFLPQENSAETTYTLTVSGIDNTAFSVEGYTLNALDGDFMLSSGEPSNVQDLWLTTRYTLTPNGAIRTLGQQITSNLQLFVISLLVLLLPGALWLSFLPPFTQDNSSNVAISLAFGASIWPIIWTWSSLANLAWTATALWVVMIIGWLVVISMLTRRWQQERLAFNTLPNQYTLALFCLLLFCFMLRLLAARDLAFAPWVDSVRHLQITRIMVETGQMLQTFQPYFDLDQSLYHFGFHSIAANISLLLNRDTLDILLMLGQLINTLVLLAIYASGYLLTRRQGVGLLAAFVVGLPMFFPAYYLSWGRWTQLLGMLILSILIGLTWRLARETISAETPLIIFIALLASGLFFVHIRVFLLYVPFALLAWLFGKPNRNLPLAGILTFLLTLPRVLYLASISQAEQVVTRGGTGTYNDFPTGYITTAWETPILIVTIAFVALALLHLTYQVQALNWVVGLGLLGATLAGEWLGFIPILFNIPFLRTGLVAGLFAFVLGGWQERIGNWPLLITLWLALGHWLRTPQEHALAIAGAAFLLLSIPQLHETRWRTLILLNALWVGSLFLLLLGRRIGLPESWVINLNSMVISLFLPYALIIALAVWALWGWLRQRHWLIQITLYAGFGGMVMFTLLFSVPHQINILNNATVLVNSADLPALEWLDQNLPQDAHIAVNSWRWLGQAWSAQDGGALIVPLYQRSSTMPPPDYASNPALQAIINPFNEQASATTDWSTSDATDLLRTNGVTHIYVGVRGGFFNPAQLANNPDIELLHASQGTFIFALR